MPTGLFNEVLILILAAFIGGFLARTLSLPSVVGYIISGTVFGLVGRNFFSSYNSLVELSQLGVSLLLFTLGFEFSLDKLKSINKKVFLVGFIQVFFTALCFIPLFLLFQIDLKTSVLFSFLFSFSSTAVIVKLLEEKGLINDFPGNNVFLFLLIQDLVVIPVIFFIPLLFAQNGISMFDILLFVLSIIKTLAVFTLLFISSKFLLPKLLNLLFRYPSHELNILATIFISVASIGILTAVGVPQTIAAFFTGFLISEEGKNIDPLSEIRPIRDILLVIFFVLTGMLIDVPFILSNFSTIFLLFLFVLLFKSASIYLLLRIVGYIPAASIFIACYLANIGEFAAVIGQHSYLSGYLSKENYNILLSVFVFSLVAVPFWIKYFREIAEKLASYKLLKGILGESSYIFKNRRKYEINNHVIICGHGRVGSKIRSMLDFAGVNYIVIDFNRKVITQLSAENKTTIYGDPSDEEVLKSATLENARVLVVAVPDTQSQKKIIKTALSVNPKIVIICRSHIEEGKYDLLNLGVTSIVFPEFEAGLKIGSEVLEIFGFDNQLIQNHVNQLRKEYLL